MSTKSLSILVVRAVVSLIPFAQGTIVAECAGLLLECLGSDRSVFRRMGLVYVPFDTTEMNDWETWEVRRSTATPNHLVSFRYEVEHERFKVSTQEIQRTRSSLKYMT